jgi:hypothetical protein
MDTPGVREEAVQHYKRNGSAAMTDTSLVRARGVTSLHETQGGSHLPSDRLGQHDRID